MLKRPRRLILDIFPPLLKQNQVTLSTMYNKPPHTLTVGQCFVLRLIRSSSLSGTSLEMVAAMVPGEQALMVPQTLLAPSTLILVLGSPAFRLR